MYHEDKPNFLEFWVRMAKMILKVKVNDPYFKYQLRVSHDASLVQTWWFQLKSVTSYCADKVKFTDGRTEEQMDRQRQWQYPFSLKGQGVKMNMMNERLQIFSQVPTKLVSLFEYQMTTDKKNRKDTHKTEQWNIGQQNYWVFTALEIKLFSWQIKWHKTGPVPKYNRMQYTKYKGTKKLENNSEQIHQIYLHLVA